MFVLLLHSDGPLTLEDADGVSLPVPDVLVQGEDAEEGKEDTSGPKEVPEEEEEMVAEMEAPPDVVTVKEVEELAIAIHLPRLGGRQLGLLLLLLEKVVIDKLVMDEVMMDKRGAESEHEMRDKCWFTLVKK